MFTILGFLLGFAAGIIAFYGWLLWNMGRDE